MIDSQFTPLTENIIKGGGCPLYCLNRGISPFLLIPSVRNT